MNACPICNSNAIKSTENIFDGEAWDCERCGKFKIARTLLSTKIFQDMEELVRAVLSHKIISSFNGKDIPSLNTYYFESFINSKPKLPSIAQQANNLIRITGEHYEKSGKNLEYDKRLPSKVGCLNDLYYFDLVRELLHLELLKGKTVEFSLTLKGSQKYEEEHKGQFSSKYGFVALQFDNEDLRKFLDSYLKPKIYELGYDLYSLDVVSKTGLIDNHMRIKIRDAAFVIADLSDGNSGAYWEAGFAEGLGKPVLYICEKQSFNSSDRKLKPHFDISHCYIIEWDKCDIDKDIPQLIPTLQRSLNLPPTKN